MNFNQVPVTKTGMLIRRPISDVFNAFVDPTVTTKFWFTKGSGKLEQGKVVRWEWEMYGFSIEVKVKVIEPNKRIVIEWPGNHGPTTVEWTFKSLDAGTFVDITNSGFAGSGDDMVKEALDTTGGFCWVLAGCKAYLEHKLELNLVSDRFPKELENS
jgi:uncharacterized protein YndB with AHSA1/START domain